MKRTTRQRIQKSLFPVGIVVILLAFFPYLLLGQGAVFTYHDQLDGEMVAYVLQAKHLGEGSILPEFLGGALKTALTPPAPACVLWFRVMSPLRALSAMQLLGWLSAYTGMFLLIEKATGKRLPAFLGGILYAFLPFLPVYGLSQYGLPLLLWCVWNLEENQNKKLSLFYGIVYALHSSLVLVGFGVLLALACRILWGWLRKKKNMGNLCALFGGLVLAYVVTNLTLVLQVLGIGKNAQMVSHKSEYALVPENFLQGIRTAFLHGGQHSEDYHITFLFLLLLLLVLYPLWNQMQKKLCRVLTKLLLWIAVLCVISALWNDVPGIWLRSHIGALGAFQMDRLLWLAPCLWYLGLGCGLGILLLQVENEGRSRGQKTNGKVCGLLSTGILLLAAVICLGADGIILLKNSDVKANIKKCLDPSYPAISYEDYYAIDVLDQVEEFLAEKTGKAQEDYRVVSLGIDPAAALMHGFYCLDGYSNNYSLEYKHRFREVIAPALEQSEYLKDYFDGWGNRCYLFGTESPGYYTIEKGGFYFSHLEINTEALAQMGGDYLFSAAYIGNSADLGLELMCEEPFETQDSYYRIYVYQIK